MLLTKEFVIPIHRDTLMQEGYTVTLANSSSRGEVKKNKAKRKDSPPASRVFPLVSWIQVGLFPKKIKLTSSARSPNPEKKMKCLPSCNLNGKVRYFFWKRAFHWLRMIECICTSVLDQTFSHIIIVLGCLIEPSPCFSFLGIGPMNQSNFIACLRNQVLFSLNYTLK